MKEDSLCEDIHYCGYNVSNIIKEYRRKTAMDNVIRELEVRFEEVREGLNTIGLDIEVSVGDMVMKKKIRTIMGIKDCINGRYENEVIGYSFGGHCYSVKGLDYLKQLISDNILEQDFGVRF